MRDHYIVCGEESEPTWDNENNEVAQFDYHGAHENARERAEEKPGERFHVYRAVSWTETPIGEPVTTHVPTPLNQYGKPVPADADAASRSTEPSATVSLSIRAGKPAARR